MITSALREPGFTTQAALERAVKPTDPQELDERPSGKYLSNCDFFWHSAEDVVKKIFGYLDQDERTVLEMRYMQDRPYKEIAREMKLSVDEVRILERNAQDSSLRIARKIGFIQ